MLPGSEDVPCPLPHSTIVIMSMKAAQKLSIPQLLRVLDKKLDMEYSRGRQTPIPLTVLEASLPPEVRTRYLQEIAV